MGDDPAAGAVETAITALRPVLGEDVEVTGMRPLTSGASRRSWRFDAGPPSGPAQAYVLQEEMMARDASVPADMLPLAMDAQAALLRAAQGAGVPVAPVVASGSWEGREYMISGWLDGEALPPKMLRDPGLEEGRARLMDDCARALVAIHGIPPEGLGLQKQDKMALYRARLDQIREPRPVLELGYRWLMERRPATRPPVVTHGDFRLGNLMVGKAGLQGVLDWELAHLGDPHEDVAWATLRPWRFERHRTPGTFPEPEEWAAAYDRAAGSEGALDPDALRWWQIAGTWVWAVMSAMQARRHLDGWVQSLEHAVIGRRVCESEWDLLELLP